MTTGDRQAGWATGFDSRGGTGADRLWSPSRQAVEESRLTEFVAWLAEHCGREFDDYDALWRWSTDELEQFWAALWEFFEIDCDGDPSVVLGRQEMPGATWFPDVRLNYAEHAFRGKADEETALLYASESTPVAAMTWGELRLAVARTARALRSSGVEKGDRVVGFVSNTPEAVIAFLASASIGAVWSSASPDFGAEAVRDRFAQIEPKVLFAVDGYRYGGRDFDRLPVVAELRAALPTVTTTVLIPCLDVQTDTGGGPVGAIPWSEFLQLGDDGSDSIEFERVPFDHPLWILYSSGTTGLPKAIVQGQGGILIEHLKWHGLHVDARAGDRIFWYTTTGWMMWNFLVSGLLFRAAVVLYDGNPAYPDLDRLWDLAEEVEITTFGTSAAFISACVKADMDPKRGRRLSRLRAVGSTGSPLSPEGFDWIYRKIGADTWLFSSSGGTDVCTPFVGGVPTLPVYRGELQGRALGVAVEAWNESGQAVIDEVGELVVTKPMPSMPIRLWNDPGGARYRESYFDLFPGVWRHGDWLEITSRGTAVIYGRSDSTINRSGIRLGTAEIYRAVLQAPEVLDALAVDLPVGSGDGWLALFVVLGEGAEMTPSLEAGIKSRIRKQCSPRHVPDHVEVIDEIPRTLSGKILEVPVKRILMGVPVDRAASPGSLANPGALKFFVEFEHPALKA